MKSKSSTTELLQELIRLHGESKAKLLLKSLIKDSEESSLTIIVNKTLHQIPKRYLRGKLYIASEGNLSLESATHAKATYKEILSRLATFLASGSWKTIYLIPTGHPTLSAAVKLAVYQVTRKNTVDLFFANGKYFDLNVTVRDAIGSTRAM